MSFPRSADGLSSFGCSLGVVGSMFLNGELRDGKLKSKDMKIVRQYVLENADELQALWNEYQKSAY